MSTNLSKSPQAWHDEQRRTIGSSLSAATFGEHEFITPLEAYQILTGGDVPDISNKPDIIRGNMLEPIAAVRLEQTLGIKLVHHPQDQFLYNPEYPWAHCLPDYFIEGHPIIAEIKVPNPYTWERLEENIPTYIQAQLYHQLAITGAEAICLVALNPVSMDIFRQVYTPDAEAIELLMEAERAFWENHILPRIPPPPQTHEDLKLLWPEAAAGTRAHATAEIEEDMQLLALDKMQAKHLDSKIEDASLRVKTFMEDKEVLVSEGGKIIATWKSHPVTALDAKLLKESRPEVWAEFSKDRPQRTFLVKSKNLIS